MNLKTFHQLKQIKIEIKKNNEYFLLNNNYKPNNKYLFLLKRYKLYKNLMDIYKQYKNNKNEILDFIELASESQASESQASESQASESQASESQASESQDEQLLKSINLELSIFREKIKKSLKEIKKSLKEIKKSLKEIKKERNQEINSAIIELRAGTGGNEACIFVEEILRMYTMYFQEVSWKFKLLNYTTNSYKGYKEVIIKIYGKNVYNILKSESGVHRVQRIPETEAQGRLHTSAITVAVLPEINKKVKISLNPEEIKRESFRSRGAGGQNVNKTETAIRLTHLPTGIIAECQEERSQHKNLEKAMKVLKDRILNLKISKQIKNISTKRKLLISTGDRSGKIRTYNFHKGRVTDHRLKKSFYNLEEFMNGKIENLINSFKYLKQKIKKD
ncbi:PCRF domain-containing protein [Candidatus Karelsulcia muelleri]